MANLKGSKTEGNLKAAFAGESQANRRYLYFAQKADVEGYNDVAAVFRSTAEGETGHAHGHLEFLEVSGDPATGLPIGETSANLKAAMTQDPRHRRVEKSELPGMEIYLTTAGTPQPVSRFDALSPVHDAILLKSGAREAVVLPGEARTLRYLLAFAKAKAGVRKGEPYQVFRLPVEVVPVD